MLRVSNEGTFFWDPQHEYKSIRPFGAKSMDRTEKMILEAEAIRWNDDMRVLKEDGSTIEAASAHFGGSNGNK